MSDMTDAEKAAYNKGLEDAAKCIEQRQTNNVGMVHPIAKADAADIRALKK